jgi:broad specificity phosphatase PhoE
MPEWDSPSQSNDILNSYSPTSVLSKLGQPVMYVVRHGNVKADSQEKIRGLINPDLDDKGEKQAQEIADFFADIQVSRVAVDDLNRTRQTAMPLIEAKNIPLDVDTDLRSWDLGDIEGEPIEDHEEDIKQFKNNPEVEPVAGQSWGDFSQQATNAFRRYLRISMEGLPVVVITHGSFIQVILKMLGDDVGEGYHEIPVEPGGIIAITLDRNGFHPQILTGEVQSQDE